MSRLPRIVGIIAVVVGVISIIVGITVYVIVHNTLSDQQITVSDDAPFLSGHDVTGPFSAYAEAMALNEHALDAGGGKTYAELGQDDPARTTVMTADFLQASLFTSVVAFGVAFLVGALGVIFVLIGLTLVELDRRTAARATSPPTDEVAAAPA